MKNFPHQFSEFAKIRAALAAIRDLLDRGRPVGDDDELGYELARRGIYTFRNLGSESVDDRIKREREKPPSSQGARTAARDFRRTLVFLRFIEDGAGWRITDSGHELLASAPESSDERNVWLTALYDLSVEDASGRVSHPIRLLLWLVHHFGNALGPGFRGMELALEASDDSATELARIAELAQLTDPERSQRLQEELGVSAAQIANARKILPAFARNAGLIAGGGTVERHVLTDLGRAAYDEAFGDDGDAQTGVDDQPSRRSRSSTAPGSRRSRRHAHARRVTPETVAAVPSVNPEAWEVLSEVAQREAIRLRLERNQRHQELVKGLAGVIGDTMELSESASSFDLLGEPVEAELPAVVFEVKSLADDARKQVERASFQLHHYRFAIRQDGLVQGREIRLAAVFEQDVGDFWARLLNEMEIAAFTYTDNGLGPLNDLARTLLNTLFGGGGEGRSGDHS